MPPVKGDEKAAFHQEAHINDPSSQGQKSLLDSPDKGQ